MAGTKKIWVLPEIDREAGEISRNGLGLLTEARDIAGQVGGSVVALLLGDETPDFSETLGQYGVAEALVFTDPLLNVYSADACTAALLEQIRRDAPWLFLLNDNVIGREVTPRLAALLDTGLVTGCASLDLSEPGCPVFYRYVYGDQLYQEITVPADGTIFVTMDSRVLNITPLPEASAVKTNVIKPELPSAAVRTRHIDFLPADYQTVDVSEADVIVAAGMGAATGDLLPLVEELAGLIEGTIGTTRPVIDEGKIPRERMIGQTGKVVSPDFYLALGISGASHHVGGIQDSRRIASVNLDPQAAIFGSSDVGAVADLKQVLPVLIEKIRQAKENGEIL
jgi:electron transfer flavoprotein alpha subunit